MALNVEAGLVDPAALVYAPGVEGANELGFTSVDNLLAQANTALQGDEPLVVVDGNPLRPDLAALKTALDNANNNRTFVI
jgi:hypothetical protein